MTAFAHCVLITTAATLILKPSEFLSHWKSAELDGGPIKLNETPPEVGVVCTVHDFNFVFPDSGCALHKTPFGGYTCVERKSIPRHVSCERVKHAQWKMASLTLTFLGTQQILSFNRDFISLDLPRTFVGRNLHGWEIWKIPHMGYELRELLSRIHRCGEVYPFPGLADHDWNKKLVIRCP